MLFLSESESPGVQEFIEEGEIHFIAHGSSFLADQACIIPERLTELEGFNEPLFTSGGVRVFAGMLCPNLGQNGAYVWF